MTRFNGDESILEAILKLSEGNPGATTACIKAYQNSPNTDPDAPIGGFYPLMLLDDLEVYGSDIWTLYKDVCDEDMHKFLAVLRGYRLGLVTKDAIHRAIQNRGAGLDADALLIKVHEQLPNFAKLRFMAEEAKASID